MPNNWFEKLAGGPGENAFSVIASPFFQPAVGSSVTITVDNTHWIPVGIAGFADVGGSYTVVSVNGLTSVTLRNTGSASNAAPGAIVPAGGRFAPGGTVGPAGDPATNLVTSVFGRVGVIAAALNDYTSSLIQNLSSVTGGGSTVTTALNALQTQLTGLVTGVSSVFGRTGAITATLGDYGSTKITNFSSAPGSTVDDALTYLRFGPENPFSRTVAGSTTLAINDRRRLIRITAASTVTVPLNASVAFLEGDVIRFLAETTGAITFVGATGAVNIRQASTFTNTIQYVFYRLQYLAADEWLLTQEAHAYHPLSIVNADVNSAAAIAGTKISPDFGSQAIATTGSVKSPSYLGSDTLGFTFDVPSGASNYYLFRVNSSPLVSINSGNFISYCQDNYLGLNQGATTLSKGNSSSSGALASLTVQATNGNGSGTYTGGLIAIVGGNGNTGTGTGGDALIGGGGGVVASGNVAVHAVPVSWQSMSKGVFIANCATLPSGNPTGGGFLFVDAGALKYRGSSGTVTTLAPA
jgi:hypothetical protein